MGVTFNPFLKQSLLTEKYTSMTQNAEFLKQDGIVATTLDKIGNMALTARLMLVENKFMLNS